MIDIHTHVLPDLDDGPPSIEESLALVRAAWYAGTRTLVATPHVLNRIDEDYFSLILQRYHQLHELLQAELPKLLFLLGSEIYFQPGLIEFVRHKAATLNGTGRYMLVEFPLIDIPNGFAGELLNLAKSDIVPIIAHPERNARVIRQPALVGEMIEAGALIQVNAGSITGSFGRAVKKLARNLLKRKWIHFIASDAHSLNSRGPNLREAFDVAADLIGVAAARRLVQDNPQIVLKGLPQSQKKSLEFTL